MEFSIYNSFIVEQDYFYSIEKIIIITIC